MRGFVCKGSFTRGLVCVVLLMCVVLGVAITSATAQEPLRVRRNFFGSHNLKDGGPAFQIGMDWTAEMNGPGFVFDWVTDPIPWVSYAFQRNLIPCIRVQNCNGGCTPAAWYAGEMCAVICNYKLQNPQYADRIVYLQLWNEPGDRRDWVEPEVFADFMVAAYGAVKNAEAAAAAQNPNIAGTMLVMSPGQNGPYWWEEAFAHNPNAKFAFDVWGTHPYPESSPPWWNLHDGECPPNTVKCIDSYLLDLDKIAENHNGVSRVGFPVMITETAYGDHLGISFEGYPKTTRQMAADYNVSAFGDFWYKWPEIVAVQPFILANISWNAFAFVDWQSGSTDTNGNGILEPTNPFPQYTAVMNLRKNLEAQGKLAPARKTPYRGPKGTIQGTITRSDNGQPVKYATLFTDGYEFGNTSVYNGKYAIRDVPAGTYTLTCNKHAYRGVSKQVTVVDGQTTTVDFSLLYTGKDAQQIYFVDTPHGGCSGCSLFSTFHGQTFKTGADHGFVKYAAAKPNVGGLYLKFTVIEGDNPNGTPVGSFNSYYLEPNFPGEMIGGEAPGDGIPVKPNTNYFLKIERLDGQGVYLYASSSNPFGDGCAWVGNTKQAGWDLYGCIRLNKVAVFTDVGTISGNVKSASGQNLSGVTVSTNAGGYSATTDTNGNYVIANVLTGSYDVTATKSGYQSGTQAGKTVSKDLTTTVNFTLAVAPTGSIAGNVKNANNLPLQGATISTSPGGYTGTTDAGGSYTINGVNVGMYSVTASKSGYQASTASGKVVNQNLTSTANFTLQSALPFAGLVNGNFEGGSRNDPDGDHAVANSWYKFVVSGSPKYNVPWLTTWHGGNYGQSFYEASWVAGIYQQCANATVGNGYSASVWVKGTDSGQKFWIGIDPTGGTSATSTNTQWSAESTPGATWVQISKQVAAQNSTVTVFVKAQNTIGANRYVYIDDAAITESGPTTGAISGQVRDSAGAPLSGASVSTSTGGYTATSAADGSYTMPSVTPGTYSVTAVKSGYNNATVYNVPVTAGGTAGADITMLDASAPTEPLVADDATYTTNTTQLHATWFSSDPQSGVAEYKYAIGTTQGGTDVVGWTSVGANTSITRSVSLSLGQTYYFAVQAKNRDGLWSVVGKSNGIKVARAVDTIPMAKKQAIGSAVSMNDKVITAADPVAFWIEEQDRSGGIKVVAPNALSAGHSVDVAGIIARTNGEYLINAAEYSILDTVPIPTALGLMNHAVGEGAENIGLLVRVWGVVKSTYADRFFIDDGSGRADFSGETGLKVYSGSLSEPVVGKYVIVTGVVTMENVGGVNVPVVVPRAQGDVVVL